jgi:hypothetical protein
VETRERFSKHGGKHLFAITGHLVFVGLIQEAVVPKSAPTPEVAAMAKTPQNITRRLPIKMRAPPACAATAPRIARQINDVVDTNKMRTLDGVRLATSKGIAAPMASSGPIQVRLE